MKQLLSILILFKFVLLLLIPNLSWAVELGENDDLSGNFLFCIDSASGGTNFTYVIEFTEVKLVSKDPEKPNSSEKTYQYFADFVAVDSIYKEPAFQITIYSGTVTYATGLEKIWIGKEYATGDNLKNIEKAEVDDIAINRQTLKYKKDSFRKGQCELKDEKEYLSKAKIYWEREQLEFLERKRQEKELLEKNKKL